MQPCKPEHVAEAAVLKMVRLHGDSSNTTTQQTHRGTGGKGPTQHPTLPPYSTLPPLNSTSLAAVHTKLWAPGTKWGGWEPQGPRAQDE